MIKAVRSKLYDQFYPIYIYIFCIILVHEMNFRIGNVPETIF